MTKTPETLPYLNEALVNAASQGDTHVVKGLIALGADVHWRQELPLRQAALGGHIETIKELRQLGAAVGDAILASATFGSAIEVAVLISCAPETVVVSTLCDAMKSPVRSAAKAPRNGYNHG
jgi:hypothetical protein